MGKKGGGGGVDTSGLEQATRDATKLQKQIYEETRQDVQPWYNMGTGAVSKLSDLLGVSGGSVLDRDQIYNELLPQYTTQQQVAGSASPNLFTTPDGRVVDISDPWRYGGDASSGLFDEAKRLSAFQDNPDYLVQQATHLGWTPMGGYDGATTKDSVDYAALNAAVEERLGSQATPEGYGSLLERFDLSKFEEDPSYQFRQDEGNKALERAMAAQGVTLGGGGYGTVNPQVARALQEQNQNLASMEYGNAYNRYTQDQLNTYNMLLGAAGMGQGSTGIMATAGQNYGTNVGNLQTGLASAQMNAQMAQQSQPSMFSTILGAGAQLGSAYLMSDRRIKTNIKQVGYEMGHKIYEFDYLDGSGRYRGVMADEVLEKEPDAVKVMPNGYMAVNYDMIGLQMERV